MQLKWLLISSEGVLDRKTFWFAILSLNFLSMILDEIGNSIFLDIGQDRISFFMFFFGQNDSQITWDSCPCIFIFYCQKKN